jgi:hypothetical protein
MTNGYQACVIDPEGDYGGIDDIIPVGDVERVPTIAEVMRLLERPTHSIVVNLLGMPMDQRPVFLAELCPQLHELRDRTGRPHWLIIDEAHHLLPAWGDPECQQLSPKLPGLVLVTVDPRHLLPREVQNSTIVVVLDSGPRELLLAYADVSGHQIPASVPASLEHDEGLAWFPESETLPVRFHPVRAHSQHRRHRRKYAESDLGPERSFRFRGARGALDVSARNLGDFVSVAWQVDDDVWLYHARRGDYSNWIRGSINDVLLADEIAVIEARRDLSPDESRRAICGAIEEFYTLPV